MFQAYANLARSLGVPTRRPQVEECGELPTADSHEAALLLAHSGARVALDSSRVRVGVTRGHLLEIVVQVPLDVAGDPEALQLGSEIYLESLLGTALLDEWVASVAIDRIARSSGLLVLSDARSSAPAHPLGDAASLIHRGVDAIRKQLPESLFARDRDDEGWTALEIPEAPSGLQPERRFASTRFPEALKCVLEGMPFSSTRFTRGTEKFCWLSWRGRGATNERLEARAAVEALLADEQSEDHLLLSGTGFGPRRDYLDLWLDLSWAKLPRIISRLRESVDDLELGLYDSPYSEEPLRLGD